MTDNRVSVQYVYATEERQFEHALSSLTDNGCQAGSGTKKAEWRVRIEGERDQIKD